MSGSSRPRICYGAGRDPGRRITTHGFCITLNHAGSTFLTLTRAPATGRATWNLGREAQATFGYAGPAVRDHFGCELLAG